MRTEGYIIRSVGGITGAVLGAILYNKSDWGWGLTIGQCCVLQAAIPCVTLLPLTPWLLDVSRVQSLKDYEADGISSLVMLNHLSFLCVQLFRS
jgi:hypothetical protein